MAFEGGATETELLVSVLLPTNRGLPYLAESVRDVVRQELGEGHGLELVVAVDGDEADWAFMVDVVESLGRGEVSEVSPPPPKGEDQQDQQGQGTGAVPAWAPAGNPVAVEEADERVGGETEVDSSPPPRWSPAEVAAACRPEHVIRAARYADGKNRGQGAAMSLALAQSRKSTRYVAQMEADDRRPCAGALKAAIAALEANGWDGCATEAVCFGPGATERMTAYCEWQNSLKTPEDLSRGRFVEIPALHQTAVFKRTVVEAVLAPTAGCYRDGPWTNGDDGDDLDVPVDMWWWLCFFHAGFRCGRVVGCHALVSADLPILATDPPKRCYFGWRQHAAQRTRKQTRLSVANLRAIKLHFLLNDIRRRNDDFDIVVISVGATLDAWVADLRARWSSCDVKGIVWRPSKRAPPPSPYIPPEALRENGEERDVSPDHPPDRPHHQGTEGVPEEPDEPISKPRRRLLRLWAYGDARVRVRIKAHVDDWDVDWDIFVA